MNYEKTGKLIQELRKEKGLTQMSLAEKLGVTDRAVSKWERGKSFPDVSMLRPLAEALGISVSELLDEKLQEREGGIAVKGDRSYITICDEGPSDYYSQAIAPILCEGDVIGSVILLQNDSRQRMGEIEWKLIQSAASFLGRQMEQ